MAPGDTLITAPGLPPHTLLPYGRDPTSIAFFRLPGTERLYSGVTKSRACLTCGRPSQEGLGQRSKEHLVMSYTRRAFAHTLSAIGLAVGTLGLAQIAHAADTIKVGILHSLSGTMAISETVLKDVALMTIDEINAKGGVMGKKLEPVVVDPASNWPLFAEKTKQLITQDKVAVIFGCWTSVSRKSVLPVVEELNGLLFYPV